LIDIGEKIENLSAILISHEHSDHIKGVKSLSRNFHHKFWISYETYQKIVRKTGSIDAEFFDIGESFKIGEIEIMPYEVSHDAVDPTASLISYKRKPILGYLCDCGYPSPFLIDGFRGVEILIVEANHSMDVLLQSDYPEYLKYRILGSKGHLSNWHTAEFIAEVKPHVVFLAHISENNNDPNTALSEIDFILSHKKGFKYPFFILVPLKGRSMKLLKKL
jgi:phosphoribosyl 1,2-cyclic phosphodiesterase